MAILNEGFTEFLERVRIAEQLGFEMVCFGDSQSMFREAYVSNTAMVIAHEPNQPMCLDSRNPLTCGQPVKSGYPHV